MLNKRFRSAQKAIDKEAARAQATGNELEKTLQRPVTVGEVSSVLGTMVENLSFLKRKVSGHVNVFVIIDNSPGFIPA